jgi:hypothetical protein
LGRAHELLRNIFQGEFPYGLEARNDLDRVIEKEIEENRE